MLEPTVSLAFAIQSNKGTFGLLLGSGISRSSGIPTGWEIVLELVRKVATLSGEDCEPDPAAWYAEKFGEQPDYGKLLDMVAKTPSERQALLRPYFEPTENERDQGLKMPTKAHRAIAKLVAAGYVRVILTTNFDRLMERALEDEGISPVVISSADHVEGAQPLAHMHCCVVKVHGDYLDTRIRNTPTELETYDEKMNAFLDRVFDEFGMVVCGWSADWDVALRAAMERAPSRRYSTFWATRGALGQAAQDLVAWRGGNIISTTGADELFVDLESKVTSIEEFNKPHPLSRDIAVASTKRYLRSPEGRIQLSDLIHGLARDLADQIGTGELAQVNIQVDSASVTKRVRTYDALSSTLVAVAEICGHWGDESTAKCLARARERIYAAPPQGGQTLWLDYMRYPATLITYAAMLGASISSNFAAMSSLLKGSIKRFGRDVPVGQRIPPFGMLGNGQDWGRLLEGMGQRYAPLNDWLHDVLWREIGYEFTSKDEFSRHFDHVEILLALASGRTSSATERRWYAPGRFGYKSDSFLEIKEVILDSLKRDGDASPYARCHWFGDNASACETELNNLETFCSQLPWH
ncbi:SIR2 family protein [Paraburkholderia dinghuensis]|uniref:Deacetylase sirtuin-type domain-containing protein n=1 Tax=Paraburkholderia dinghuensis TaxID=2305225 RepID=A0A3N6NKQ8_9BURK|nr:SIR2 family protein [Paraburkholderia dinghuensis]RQG99862.1 hypothetical protein D1Y85_25960 [Paraburkholderia dinghuensis]